MLLLTLGTGIMSSSLLPATKGPEDDEGEEDDFRGRMLSFRLVYIFSYNLFQFCGHTWILANTIARFLTFGKDALADTFYSVGFVMSLCQLLSILELFHIADGIEKARLLPRFVQVTEKNLLLIMVIMLEEIQSKPVVCVQLFLWNILDLLRYAYLSLHFTSTVSYRLIVCHHAPGSLSCVRFDGRYPHELLCVMDTPSIAMLWTRYTLWIPLYILSVATEGVTIYQALPYVEPMALKSLPPPPLNSTVATHAHVPVLLVVSLPVLALGAAVTVWQVLKERQHHLEKWNKKKKKK
ncbi:very-long-chain (3R)-3-hydroxyacyl-CoA dehydratase 4 isoform X1 [Enoplosus armatus]|uniref:very-long-chain (3R)-3-hydroxyacyl-CoA dehydratase 4 isoform X1 n=1 Tax=Enoplosus armatus TaxID=215367 RepID=UPI003990F83A